MIRLVLFDIDGTLIQSGGAGVRAFGRALETEFSIPNGTGGVHFAGRTDTGLAREIFTRHGVATHADNFRRFFDCYVFWLDHLLGEARGRVCPGVAEFLAGLRALPQPPALGLLTGNIRLGAEIKLRHHGLWEHFMTGAFGDDHEERNELARVSLQRARRSLGKKLGGDEILVIGDTARDIECGRAIGARVLAVATGGAALGELQTHRPDWLAEDLTRVTAGEVCA
ncbi:MAG: HAD family hydrolase [Verrucomicrobia bacterium]|nr:HAD family hydrolase [Verrucomicrobiota bacterium]